MVNLNISEDEESGTTTIYLCGDDGHHMYKSIIRIDDHDFDGYISAINDVYSRLLNVKYSLFDICIAKLRSDIVKHKVFEQYKISTFQVINGARDTTDDTIRMSYSNYFETEVCIICKFGIIPLKNIKSINVSSRVCEQIVELVNELDYVINNYLDCDSKNARN